MNEEGAENCDKCGASLRTARAFRRYRYENECFGVPMRGYTWGLLFGALIVLWGVSELLGYDFNFWALFAVAFGLLMVWNALQRNSGGLVS